MSTRERTVTALWAATVILSCTLVYHLAVGHRPGGEVPVAWPPAPDTAALLDVRLPATTPLNLVAADMGTRIWTWFEGNIRLDEVGLELALGPMSRLQVNPSFPRPISLETTTLALAESSATGWRIVKEGTPSIMSGGPGAAGDDLPLPREPLKLDGVGVLDLPGRWPVIIHTVRIEDPEVYEEARMRLFAHGGRGAFDDLLGRQPWAR